MRVDVVDLPANDRRGVEDAMAPVDDVIVEREHHQRRIGDDPVQLARIEGPEVDWLLRAERSQLSDDVFLGEDGNRACVGRHGLTTNYQPPTSVPPARS